jgi:hypothetical protein
MHPDAMRAVNQPVEDAFEQEHDSGGFKIETHATSERCRDVNQRIEREPGNPAAEQVVDPWLGYAAAFGRFSLCPAVLLQARGNLLHQFGH